jgi:N-acetylglucosaminyldiphosphoundecaprenol N-acetyl-beta-D-mannosaminyltransferase
MHGERSTTDPVYVWGLPLAPLTLAQTADAMTALVKAGRPSYIITANTHYAMLTARDKRLADVNTRASLIVADGTPLVWAARWQGTPIPERVAGSDLIYALCERAAVHGFRVFLLGGAPGVAEKAGRRLADLYPGLRVVGTASPPYRELSPAEREGLCRTIRSARPDILIVAFGQPKAELWIAEHSELLGVPVSTNLGAALDFVAGRVRRAPRSFQRMGMEWAYRMWCEPARLAPRYARNAQFMAGMIARDAAAALRGRAFGHETAARCLTEADR